MPQGCGTPEPNLVPLAFAKRFVLGRRRPVKAGMRCGLPLLSGQALPAQPGVGQQSAMPFANLLGVRFDQHNTATKFNQQVTCSRNSDSDSVKQFVQQSIVVSSEQCEQ